MGRGNCCLQGGDSHQPELGQRHTRILDLFMSGRGAMQKRSPNTGSFIRLASENAALKDLIAEAQRRIQIIEAKSKLFD